MDNEDVTHTHTNSTICKVLQLHTTHPVQVSADINKARKWLGPEHCQALCTTLDIQLRVFEDPHKKECWVLKAGATFGSTKEGADVFRMVLI
jgi:hypothetical protein